MKTKTNYIGPSTEIDGGDDDVEVTHPFDPKKIDIITTIDAI